MGSPSKFHDDPGNLRPMKVFLNRYMATNRHLGQQSEDQLRESFSDTITALREAKGNRVFRIASAINAAIFDSVMTGVAKRLADGGQIDEPDELAAAYDALLGDPAYRAAVERATADEESVKTRLERAEAAFADVP